MRWKIKCCYCSKENSFGDAHDVSQARWKIIAWDVKTAEPKVMCDTCIDKQDEKKEKV